MGGLGSFGKIALLRGGDTKAAHNNQESVRAEWAYLPPALRLAAATHLSPSFFGSRRSSAPRQ
jgi:hypothetical protein